MGFIERLGQREKAKEQKPRSLENRLLGFVSEYRGCDEYTLPIEGWKELSQISGSLDYLDRHAFAWIGDSISAIHNPVLIKYFGRSRGEVDCEFDKNHPGMVGNAVKPAEDFFKNPPPLTENRRKALESLKKGDYETFKRVISHIFYVRYCNMDHTLFHGILPFANGTFSYPGSALSQTQKLTPKEYIDRLERILLEGLSPSVNGVHHSSDPQIPGAYFTADIRDFGDMPWGELIVVTRTHLLENPVFRCSSVNPFLCCSDYGFNDHIVYNNGPIMPKEPFKVLLRDRIPSSSYDYRLDVEEYEEIKSELERRRIRHTLTDSFHLPPYHAIKR